MVRGTPTKTRATKTRTPKDPSLYEVVPTVFPITRVPQTAEEPGQVLDIVDESKRAKFPSVNDTTRLILACFEKANTGKFGLDKAKIFPCAALLAKKVALLEYLRDEDGLWGPLEEEQHNKRSTAKHATQSNYALLESHTGILFRKGLKGGYAVPRERMHQVLVWAHEACDHGGRDRTYEQLTRYYSVENIPKKFVGEWIGMCPDPAHKHGRGRAERAQIQEEPSMEMATSYPTTENVGQEGQGPMAMEFQYDWTIPFDMGPQDAGSAVGGGPSTPPNRGTPDSGYATAPPPGTCSPMELQNGGDPAGGCVGVSSQVGIQDTGYVGEVASGTGSQGAGLQDDTPMEVAAEADVSVDLGMSAETIAALAAFVAEKGALTEDEEPVVDVDIFAEFTTL